MTMARWLEVPCRLPPGPVDVVLVVQPSARGPLADPAARPTARSGLFAGKGPGDLDLDAITGEIDAGWRAKLADLEP